MPDVLRMVNESCDAHHQKFQAKVRILPRPAADEKEQIRPLSKGLDCYRLK